MGRGLTSSSLSRLRQDLGTNNVIIKPTVGANADFTFPTDTGTNQETNEAAFETFRDREFLAQGFVQSVVSEGEYSLFFFNGKESHAILKTPKQGDFRVQEEHGGTIIPVTPDQPLREAGIATLRALDEVPLYARADFVRDAEGKFCLMELELIEPALYFRMDPGSAGSFARAVNEWMQRKPSPLLS
jgi:hypothetical protein